MAQATLGQKNSIPFRASGTNGKENIKAPAWGNNIKSGLGSQRMCSRSVAQQTNHGAKAMVTTIIGLYCTPLQSIKRTDKKNY